METFTLNTQLQADTSIIAESELNLLLLMNDSRYPWCILVPKQAGLREVYELSHDDQLTLLEESCLLAKTLMSAFPLDKMNIGALGNVVSQLHIHHVGRTTSDPAWPAPVWGHSPATAYSAEHFETTKGALEKSPLSSHFKFGT